MSVIKCTVTPFVIGKATIILLPKSASAALPSRGMVMVEGVINGSKNVYPLEPDGRGSHWFRCTDALCEITAASSQRTLTLEIEPIKEWTEPDVPEDVKNALAAASAVQPLWERITPMARWDWIRWIRAAQSTATRRKRIDTMCSMLNAGKRRPCCFNRNLCTDPSVSKGGVLLNPR